MVASTKCNMPRCWHKHSIIVLNYMRHEASVPVLNVRLRVAGVFCLRYWKPGDPGSTLDAFERRHGNACIRLTSPVGLAKR